MIKTQKYIEMQNVFMMTTVLAIAVICGRRINFLHGPVPALLCVGVLMVGGVGTIVLIVMKNFLPQDNHIVPKLKRNVPITEIPEGDSVAWDVVDRTTRSDYWRCSMILLVYRWQTYSEFFPPIYTCSGIALLIASQIAIVPCIGIAIFLVIARLLFMGHRIWSKYRVFCNNRYPRIGYVRTCTTALTRIGYLYVSAKFKNFYPWTDISAIHESGSDIYILHVDGRGVYITRNAFRDTSEVHEFKQKAIELWRNSKSTSVHADVKIPQQM